MPFLIAIISACIWLVIKMKNKIISLERKLVEFFSVEETVENATWEP